MLHETNRGRLFKKQRSSRNISFSVVREQWIVIPIDNSIKLTFFTFSRHCMSKISCVINDSYSIGTAWGQHGDSMGTAWGQHGDSGGGRPSANGGERGKISPLRGKI